MSELSDFQKRFTVGAVLDAKRKWIKEKKPVVAHFSHYNCDICGIIKPIVLIDGRTKSGQWGLMCVDCHSILGTGLGTGKGQEYEYQYTDLSEITGEEVPIYVKVEG